ncbi:MAG: ferritin family protein [Thermoplasmata archaeon]
MSSVMKGWGCAMDNEEKAEDSTLSDALRIAMDLEEYGYSFYKDVREFVESEKGRALLEFLANQEVDHKRWLKTEHDTLEREISEGTRSDERLNIELPDPRTVFSRKDEITKSMDSIEATKFALEVEKRSIEFYSACGMMTSVETAKELFEKLSRFEKTHRKLLEENLDYLQTEGDWYGYVPILEG